MYLHNLYQFSVHVPQIIHCLLQDTCFIPQYCDNPYVNFLHLIPTIQFWLQTNVNYLLHSLANFSVMSICLILSISPIPRYLHLLLSISLTICPFGSTRSFSFTFTYLGLPSWYFQWRNVQFSLVNLFGPYPWQIK